MQTLHRRFFTIGASGLAVALGLALTAGGLAAETKITVGKTTSASGFHIPSYIAMERGFFKKEGLDAKWISLTGKALVTAGMGGSVDFVPIPGGGSVAILRGAKLVYICGQSLISQWALVTAPDIKTVADLKNKTIGYGRAGGADYDEGEITLSQFFNMKVGRDYKVISFQGETERVAAMINGSIQAGLLSFPHAAKAQVAGFKILLRTGDYLPRVGGTFWVKQDYLEKNRDTVKHFIRAIAEATQYLAHNKTGSVPVLQKYFAIKDAGEAGHIWDSLHDQYGPDIPAKLLKALFEGRVNRMKVSGMWPKDKPAPDTEKLVARDLLTPTLREMGYYLQGPPLVQGKLD